MKFKKSKKTLFIILILTFCLFPLSFFLDKGLFSLTEVLASFDFEVCVSVEEIDKKCESLSPEECKEVLNKCQDHLRERSAEIEKDITKTEQEKKTLQNKIYVLRKQIQNLDYKIHQGNVTIRNLGFKIIDTQSSIDKISSRIEDSKTQLVSILRTIYREKQKSLIEIIFKGSLSNFFDNLTRLEYLNTKLQEVLENTKDLKSYLKSKEEELGEEKDDLEKTVEIRELQRQESAETKKEKEYFLRLTEQEYQKYLEQKRKTEKTAAEIRKRVFELIGVPKAPSFGEAYEIAKYASEVTGVRPALLLAVLTQESRIGKNVGQCYLKDPDTGDGIYIKTGNKAPRTMYPGQVPYFINIIENVNKDRGLVRDPFETPVSCCMVNDGNFVGWGGAMGPAQFIPTTWQKLGYGEKVKQITGKTADPWDIKDAFLASALYLKDSGAERNEFRAVMTYFSGSSWNTWEEFYGRNVLSIAEGYEKDIAIIEK